MILTIFLICQVQGQRSFRSISKQRDCVESTTLTELRTEIANAGLAGYIVPSGKGTAFLTRNF